MSNNQTPVRIDPGNYKRIKSLCKKYPMFSALQIVNIFLRFGLDTFEKNPDWIIEAMQVKE